ncbi:hypothetical protein [Gallibacterium salpingitidis]|uniref:hypothetical protein n=1 Tax=Gallibacterium salpingitidis TaxID=505341 RepID=UPI000830E198|nr:hypothetical protein [Gallibacterium salpingitidis]
MATVIDALFFELGIAGDFNQQADEALSKIDDLEKGISDLDDKTKKKSKTVKDDSKALDDNNKNLEKHEKQSKKNVKVAKDLLDVIVNFTKTLGALGTVIMAGVGLNKLALEAANANRELDNTAKNIGISTNALANWGSAAEMAGGSAEGMTGYLGSLSSSITNMVVMGDTSLVPFFNAFGVGVLDSAGKMRNLNDILLDLSDSMSKMDRTQAYSIAKSMGMDDGTFNLLIQGRQAVEGYLNNVSKLYKSNAEDIKTSQKLTAATTYLNQQFESLQLMIANAVAPMLLKISEIVTGFFDYLQRHEDLVKGVFFGIATAISVALIPTLISATTAVFSFMAPFLPVIAIVLGLAAAFGLLYEDYAKWAKGGESLFDWGKLIQWIDGADFSIKNLLKAILFFNTGYTDLTSIIEDGKAWLELKGFMKDGKVSVDSIITGFRNLASDLINAVLPALRKVGDTISKLLDGDFEGAWEGVKDLGNDAWEAGKDLANDVWTGAKKKFTGFADVFGGYDPNKNENSMTQLEESGKLYNNEKGFKGFGAEVDGYIKEASEMFGMDEKTLRGFIKMEDGWTGKMSPTGAIGTGQFTKDTWNDLAKTKEGQAIGMTLIDSSNFRKDSDPRYNKRINTLATALLAKKNGEYLQKYGIEATGENLYMAHNIGLGAFTRAMRGNATEDDIKAMRLNGMTNEMTPQSFVRYQKSRFNRHYAQANNPQNNDKEVSYSSQTKLNENQPILGQNIANASRNVMPMLQNAQNLAQSRNISNNTQVVFNGGVQVQTSASTMSGTATDFAKTLSEDRSFLLMRNNYGVN